VSRHTVAEEVRDRLLASIQTGQIPPGQPLPSERALSEAFGVARTSVREAIQGLVTTGIIERRANRAYVAQTLPELDLDGVENGRKLRVRQLLEVRRLLEIPIAALAAERATGAERDEITRLAGMFTADLDLDTFRTLDREFHTAVARAAGNPVLAEVELKVLESLFASTEFDTLLLAQASTRAVDRIVKEAGQAHRAIAKGIAAALPVGTEAAARAHLDQVEDRMDRSSAR
jgi:GntR family transcriptional repressor for pyruvate dehydrogenase complex